jgi:hypothetical protein
MTDTGRLKTSNRIMNKLCQDDGGGVGAKPSNCHKPRGGKAAISSRHVIHQRRKLMPVTIRNVFANCFICPNVVQILADLGRNGQRSAMAGFAGANG